MLLKRFVLVLAVAFAAQAAVFAFTYRDLLALRLPAAALAASPLTLTGTAEAALARPTLTRRHLETIAEATHRAGQVDLEVRALARLAALEPGDPTIAVRYGDALRRAGRLDEAEQVFRQVLEGHRRTEARQ